MLRLPELGFEAMSQNASIQHACFVVRRVSVPELGSMLMLPELVCKFA